MSQPKLKVWIGVDPAMNRSGFAAKFGDGEILQGAVEGVRNLSTSELLTVLDLHASRFDVEIYLCIEFPTWPGVGTREIRSAATQWIAEFKARFPRRVRVHKACPKAWQPAMLEGCPGNTAKAKYLFRATQILGKPAEGEDEAAAVCLLEYGRAMDRIGAFGELPKRAKAMTAADRRKKLGRKA